MNTLIYFVLIAATMMVLSRNLPGFYVSGWGPAIFASLILAVLNAVVKPILFLLTLPITFVTLGLFLFVLNALMLWLTAAIVPGFDVTGFIPTLIGSLILSAVGLAWKAISKEEKSRDQQK